MKMNEQREYHLFSAANSNTPSMTIHQTGRFSYLLSYSVEDQSLLQFNQVEEAELEDKQDDKLHKADLKDSTSYILEKLISY